MRLSLLNIRSRLKPLVWLLLVTVLPSFSPHLAQGMVLCISESHVAVESARADHHDESRAQASTLSSHSLPMVATFGDAQPTAVDDVSCTDVPIRMTRADDVCHPVIQVDTSGADKHSVDRVVAWLDRDRPTRSPHSILSSDESTGFSSRPHSTVVLLI
ncbi:hypothetical protein [Salisaeta longa]|uniref:hypothetical protein n=1 Tax=Salisaeta longa TaxID=503170 RepID=UPI0003B6D3B6|nr:hypothetical protein [Salisaeta longa]